MHSYRFSKVLDDVSREFERPQDVLASEELTRDQKVRVLKEWELDLRELQVATDENMPDEKAPAGRNAELLRACRLALADLGVADGDSGGAPTKQGGA